MFLVIKTICQVIANGSGSLEIESVDASDLCVIVHDVLVKVVFAVEGVCCNEDVEIIVFGVMVFATDVCMIVCLFIVGVTIEVHLVWIVCIEEHRNGVMVGTVSHSCFTLWCEVDAVTVVDERSVCVRHLSSVEHERFPVFVNYLCCVIISCCYNFSVIICYMFYDIPTFWYYNISNYFNLPSLINNLVGYIFRELN